MIDVAYCDESIVVGPDAWVVTVPDRLLSVDPGVVKVLVPEMLKQ